MVAKRLGGDSAAILHIMGEAKLTLTEFTLDITNLKIS